MDKQMLEENQAHEISDKIKDITFEEFQNECCSKLGCNRKLTSQGEIRDVILQTIGNVANKEKETKTRIFDIDLSK